MCTIGKLIYIIIGTPSLCVRPWISVMCEICVFRLRWIKNVDLLFKERVRTQEFLCSSVQLSKYLFLVVKKRNDEPFQTASTNIIFLLIVFILVCNVSIMSFWWETTLSLNDYTGSIILCVFNERSRVCGVEFFSNFSWKTFGWWYWILWKIYPLTTMISCFFVIDRRENCNSRVWYWTLLAIIIHYQSRCYEKSYLTIFLRLSFRIRIFCGTGIPF